MCLIEGVEAQKNAVVRAPESRKRSPPRKFQLGHEKGKAPSGRADVLPFRVRLT